VVSVVGGAGLTGLVSYSGQLDVGAGAGITVNPDSVQVNRAVTDTWYATAAQGALAASALQSVNLGYNVGTRQITNTGGTPATLPLFGAAGAGLVPGVASSTTQFLRADGTWSAPPTSTGITSVIGNLPITVATGTTTPVIGVNTATPIAAGVMSAADKGKLDGVETQATRNVGVLTPSAPLVGGTFNGRADVGWSIAPASLTARGVVQLSEDYTNLVPSITEAPTVRALALVNITAASALSRLGGTMTGQTIMDNPTGTALRINANDTGAATVSFRDSTGTNFWGSVAALGDNDFVMNARRDLRVSSGETDSAGRIMLASGGAAPQITLFRHGTNERASVNPDGTFSTWSDVSVKRDIRNSVYGLAEVLSLRPVSFSYIPMGDDAPESLGFIAQEVREVVPEAVVKLSDDVLGLTYSTLIPVLVTAVQELSARIQQLESEATQP
jgi:hypothetical protein